MKKVVKFGGSSLASAEQFRKVGAIIHAEKERRYVVPSAPGKRFSSDTKVTDMLYDCYHAAGRQDISQKIAAIAARYQEIIDGLGLELDLTEEFATIQENFEAQAGSDYAASRGEYLNGMVMSAYLGFPFVDAAEVVCNGIRRMKPLRDQSLTLKICSAAYAASRYGFSACANAPASVSSFSFGSIGILPATRIPISSATS